MARRRDERKVHTMAIDTSKIVPGDVITALGHSFTVWIIYYQDHMDGSYDVEFIDDQLRYHHWKQEYDGGNVTHSGIPGMYFYNKHYSSSIAVIRPARHEGTYTVRIIDLDESEEYLGRYSSVESAMERMNQRSDGWIKMK